MDLTQMASSFAENNRQLEVTGLFFCIGSHFIQILEGNEKTLNRLLAKIKMDRRHINFRILHSEDNIERIFGQWNMTFLNMNELYMIGGEEISSLRNEISKIVENSSNSKDAIITIVKNLPGIIKKNVPSLS